LWLKGKTYLRKQFAVNKTFAAVKHCFSTFLRTLSFESIKCHWYWPDPQMIEEIYMMNYTDGWMSGWMGGGMWIWTVIGVLVVVLLVVVISKLSTK
jgi:hypothetical protein